MESTNNPEAEPSSRMDNQTAHQWSNGGQNRRGLPLGSLEDPFNLPRVDLLNIAGPRRALTADDLYLQETLREGETDELLQERYAPRALVSGNIVSHPFSSMLWPPMQDNSRRPFTTNYPDFTTLPRPIQPEPHMHNSRTQDPLFYEFNQITAGRANTPRLTIPLPVAIPSNARYENPLPEPYPAPYGWRLPLALVPGVVPQPIDPGHFKPQTSRIDYTAYSGSFPPGTQEHVLTDRPENYPVQNSYGQHFTYGVDQYWGGQDRNGEHSRRQAEFTANSKAIPGSHYRQNATNTGLADAALVAIDTSGQSASPQPDARNLVLNTQQASGASTSGGSSGYYPNSKLPSSRGKAENTLRQQLNSNNNAVNSNNRTSSGGGNGKYQNRSNREVGSPNAHTLASNATNYPTAATSNSSTTHTGILGLNNANPVWETNPKLLNNTRGVFIRNVPHTVTIAQVCSNIRGGAIERITMEKADAQTNVTVYFVLPDSARVYKHFTNRVGGIYWAGEQYVDTFPSFTAFVGPGNGGHDRIKEDIRKAITFEGASRCLLLDDVPKAIDEDRILHDIKTSFNVTKFAYESLERVPKKNSKGQPITSFIFRFTSIRDALSAKKAITMNKVYKGVHVTFILDDCARPLYELSDKWKRELEQAHGVQVNEHERDKMTNSR